MHKLSYAETKSLVARYLQSSELGDSPAWRKLHRAGQRPARIVMHIGCLADPAISGFLWAWQLSGLPQLRSFYAERDGLAAQGLGPTLEVDCDLNTAILFASQAPGECRIEAG